MPRFAPLSSRRPWPIPDRSKIGKIADKEANEHREATEDKPSKAERKKPREKQSDWEVFIGSQNLPTTFPYRQTLTYLLTPDVIVTATQNKHLLSAISPSHRARKERLARFVAKFEKLTRDHTSQMLGACLGTLFEPATALSYLYTIAAMRPSYKDAAFADVAKALARDVARTRHVRPPIVALLDRMRALSDRIKCCIMLQLVSASRHADLRQAKISHVWEFSAEWLAIRMEFPVWKSDPYGRHFAAKVILWPQKAAATLQRTLKRLPSYDEVRTALSGVCTPHDLRRLAMTIAAEHAAQPEHVLWLTQHAAGIRATAHVRRYVAPTLHDPMTQVQVSLSSSIWQTLQTQRLTFPTRK